MFKTFWPHGLLAAACALPLPAAAEWVDGEIVRVDPAKKALVIKHAPIAVAKMDAMTMPFKVADPALLAALKPGDKVRFDVVVREDELLVTAIKPRL